MSTRHLCPAAWESLRSLRHTHVPQTLVTPIPHLQERLALHPGKPWALTVALHSSPCPGVQAPGREDTASKIHLFSLLSCGPHPGPGPHCPMPATVALLLSLHPHWSPRPFSPVSQVSFLKHPSEQAFLSCLNLPWLPSSPRIKSLASHDLACFPLRPPASSLSAPAIWSLAEPDPSPTAPDVLCARMPSHPHPC